MNEQIQNLQIKILAKQKFVQMLAYFARCSLASEGGLKLKQPRRETLPR